MTATETGTPASAHEERRSRRIALTGGIAGNFVDQFNIFLPLTALAPALPAFAGPDGAAGVATFAVVATLLGRPLGSVVFGQLADRLGRAHTTRWAIAGTGFFSLLIALLPSYEHIGSWTAVFLLTFRFLGGMCLAGEYTSAIPLAMEWSAPRLRGLYSGLIMAMAAWAQAAVAAVTLLLLTVLGPEAYAAFGWRLSFLFGAAGSVLILAFYLHARDVRGDAHARRPAAPHVRSAASPHSTVAANEAGHLAHVVVGAFARPFWTAFLLMSGLWMLTNTTVVYATAHLSELSGIRAGSSALTAVAISAGIAQALAMSVTGHLSTLSGRPRFFAAAGMTAAVSGASCIIAFGHAQSLTSVALILCALQALTVSAYGPVGAYLSELFPAHVRSSGYGLAYSLSIVIPALLPWWLPGLVNLTGSTHAGLTVIVICAGAMVSAAGLLSGRRGAPAPNMPDGASS